MTLQSLADRVEGLSGSHDGYIYPKHSGLNDRDSSLSVDDALRSAISTVRYVWRDSGDARKSGEVLARLITGSECITLLYALEAALRARTREPATPLTGRED